MPQISAKGSKIGLETRFFCHFLKFGSLVFLEIAYSDSLQQCITTRRGKTHEKIFGDQLWIKTDQNQAQNLFFCHFLKFGSLVSL